MPGTGRTVNGNGGSLRPTCLRFATVYGVAPRMRFDLTVNEFTRDLWADKELEVFGEQFWRPYVHVRDAARSVRTALDAPEDKVAGEVFNVGRSGEPRNSRPSSRTARRPVSGLCGSGRETRVPSSASA